MLTLMSQHPCDPIVIGERSSGPLVKGTDQSAGRHRSSTQQFRTPQHQDATLRLMMQWSELGQKPHWDEAAGCSSTTKGLIAKFEALSVKDAVHQSAWKELAIGEERWKVVVPRPPKQ